jgi:hypothetical protein
MLAEKSNHNPGMSVFDTAIIKESGLPREEVNTYLGQLHSLGLIILGRKAAGADYRLVNITGDGINAISQNQGP